MDFGRMLGYTEALSKNNDRTWFHDNHRQYEQAQEDFLMVLDVMKFVLAKDAPQIGDELLFENPKNFMYRIPRDMRYSKNKTPYWTAPRRCNGRTVMSAFTVSRRPGVKRHKSTTARRETAVRGSMTRKKDGASKP